MAAYEEFANHYYRLGCQDARSNQKKKGGKYPLYSTLMLAGQHGLAQEYAAGWKFETGFDLKLWVDTK